MHTQTVTVEIPVPQLTLEMAMWITLVMLAIADAVTTIVALSIGLPEGNPLIAAAIESAGLPAVVLSQVVYVALAWYVLRIVDYGHKWVLTAGISLSMLVVINNTAAIIVFSGVLA